MLVVLSESNETCTIARYGHGRLKNLDIFSEIVGNQGISWSNKCDHLGNKYGTN